MDKTPTPHSLHNSLWKIKPQGHKDGLITFNLWGKRLHPPLRACLGIKLKTYRWLQRAPPDNTPTYIPRCSLDSAMETAWKLMTRTAKGKERGKGFLKCQGLLPADSFPITCQGLFFVVVELGFLTGKLGIQCALGAPAFLGGPKVRLEASWRLGVSPDVSYFRRKVLSWC